MAQYRYKGISSEGLSVTGMIEAARPAQALKLLDERGVEAYDLKVSKDKGRRLKTRAPKGTDYFQMMQQLSVLLGAGVPLLDSLDSLKRNLEHVQLIDQVEQVRQTLRQGGSLSEGLREHITELPPFVPVLVGLGERTGKLPEVLDILAKQLGFREELRADLRSALSYPLFLLGVGVAAMAFLFAVVVPKFSNMLGDRKDDLEGAPAVVFGISGSIQDNTTLWLIMIAGLVAAGIFASKNAEARARVLEVVSYVPGIGSWMRQVEITNWTRLMSVSLQSKANLLDSVLLARHAIQSSRNRAAFDDVARDLRAGAVLEDALSRVPDMEPLVLNLVGTGTRAGKLGTMLGLATDILDKRVRRRAEKFAKLAEPVAILTISAIVGVVVISLVTAMTSVYDVGLG